MSAFRPNKTIAPVLQVLSAQSKAGQQFSVTSYILPADVGQKPTPLSHHLHEAATTLEVLTMDSQMAGQLADSLSQDSYLDFGGASVFLVSSVFLNEGLLALLI